ncbi:hypothetical protein cypCar_00027214 [Cyprinus carpio]|nr:hypothetical protein cypCar_00027214 [Cyprinus carpio]
MKCPSWDGVERFIFLQLILKTYIFKILCDYKKTTYVCSRIILGVFVNNKMSTACALVCFLLVSVSVLAGSHTLTGLATYIRGEKAFSASIMLDDITVGYYDSETKIYVARGNTTNEDDVIDPNTVRTVSENVLNHFTERSHRLRPVNDTESKFRFDLSEPFKTVILSVLIVLALVLVFGTGVVLYKWRKGQADSSRSGYSAASITPNIRLIQKANSDSGGSRVSCLASGFYPRHINLTLFRDGLPVSDHEITGGELLPNADGTYQMRKSLEISAADKHKYTCSVTHLSLDVTLEFDFSEPFKTAILSVLIVLALVFGTGVVLYKWRKGQADSSRSGYSAASSSHSLWVLATYIKGQTPFPEFSYVAMLDDVRMLYYNVNPKVRLIQKELSSGFHVSCLATGFYPRHINLTLFRDGQPVSDHEITGGDLLPNADGTYQMRKSLEISAADKHKYTCSVTHLSLDDKLDIDLAILLSSAKTYQGIGLCELRDNNKPGQIIAKTVFDGSTTEEVGYFGGK